MGRWWNWQTREIQDVYETYTQQAFSQKNIRNPSYISYRIEQRVICLEGIRSCCIVQSATMLQNMLQNRSLQDEQTYIRRHATSCSILKHMKGFFMKNVADALRMLHLLQICGALAELVYALVLGTSGATLESSSLLRPTISKLFF